MTAAALLDSLLVVYRADEATLDEALALAEARIARKRLQRLRLTHEIERRHALAALDAFFQHFATP